SGFDTQVQLQLPVNSVHPLVIPAKTLHVAQEQVAQAKTPVALVMRQTNQPVRNLGILGRQPCLVAIAALTDAEALTSQAHTEPMALHRRLRHLASLRWPYSFPSRASLRISALMRSSAYIFFRRRFSSSS